MNPEPPDPFGFNRRVFLKESARGAAGVAVGVMSLGAKGASQNSLNVGVIGLGQQGRMLARELATLSGVRVTAICDVDVQAIAFTQAELEKMQVAAPVAMTAYEQLLDRKEIDAVVIATPDHWHAKMAVDACRAGKDVYLEQPVAHSIQDGELICRVAEQTGRIVQTGLPQRSGLHYQSAIELLHRGEIGKIHLAKAWAVHHRKSIGRCATTQPPLGVDYNRWLGPAPLRKFQANRFHNDWTWFWDYGSGELGQWGVQLLDVARWGLNLDLPESVIATGGNRYFKDDRETPDTMFVQFRYPEIDLIWEHRQWCQHGIEGRMAATAFYGDRGTLIIDRSGWKVYDSHDRLYADASEIKRSHLQNFTDCIVTRKSPTADLHVGNISMALCHLGNLAYQEGREIVVAETMSEVIKSTDKVIVPKTIASKGSIRSPQSSAHSAKNDRDIYLSHRRELLSATHRAPWQLPEIS